MVGEDQGTCLKGNCLPMGVCGRGGSGGLCLTPKSDSTIYSLQLSI